MKTLIILLLSFPALCFGQVLSLSDPNWAAAKPSVAAAAWTPASLTGLQIWLDASSAINAEGESVTNLVSSVVTYPERWATNAVAANAPYLTNTWNSTAVSALVFDGSDDRLNVSNSVAVMKNGYSCSIVVVARPNDTSSSKYVFSLSANGTSFPRDGVSFNNSEYVVASQRTLDGDTSVERYRATAQSVSIPTVVHVDFTHTNAAWATGSEMSIYTNNVLAINGAGASSTNVPNTDSTTVTMGAMGTTLYPFSGEIGEVLVYVPALTNSAHRTSLYNHLKAKYGL